MTWGTVRGGVGAMSWVRGGFRQSEMSTRVMEAKSQLPSRRAFGVLSNF